MQPRELITLEREIGLQDSLHDFVGMAWNAVEPGTPFVDSWSVGAICEHTEAALDGCIRILVINVPPGNSKSRIVSCLAPARQWIKDPSYRFICAGYGDKLVNRDAKDFQKLIYSDWYQARWADRFGLPTVQRVEFITNTRTGWRLGTTPGGEATGFHANAHLVDDPIKPEDCSDLLLGKNWEWRSRTMASRWQRAPGKVNTEVLIMQRLHCNDLAGRILEEEQGNVVHLLLPMEYDPSRRCKTQWYRRGVACSWEDPRQFKGMLLNPDRFNDVEVARLKKALGPMNAAAQLQQDPVPEGGAIYHKNEFRYWCLEAQGASLGDNAPIPGCQVLPRTFDAIIVSVDAAFKDEATSDFVVLQVWGSRGGQYYLLGQLRDQLSFTATCEAIVAMQRRFRGIYKIVIEDKANGTAIIEVLTKRFGKSFIEKAVPKRSKVDRARAVAPFFSAGDVFFPHPSQNGFSWVLEELEPEIIKFPVAKNDDQVDCMSQALTFLYEKVSYLTAAMRRLRRAA